MNNNKKNINIIFQNKHHLLALLFILFYYFYCLILFNQIIINPHDNLDHLVVYDHIIGNIFRGNVDSASNFISGKIKWFYIENIFYPFNLVHLFLSDKSFYFFSEIIKKILSYFAFYILARHLQKDKLSNVFSSLLYSSLISSEKIFGFGMVLLPYFLYLILKKDKLRLKHIIIIAIFSLNSSLVRDYLAVMMLLPLALILKFYYRNYNVLISFYLISFIAFLTASVPIILSIIDIGEIHRNNLVDENNNNLIVVLKHHFFSLFNINFIKPTINLNIFFLFLILFSIFNFREKKIIFLNTLFITIIIFSPIINILINGINFPNELGFIKSLNFDRINRIIPLIASILLQFNLSFLKNFFKKFFLLVSLIFMIFVNISLPTREILRSFFYYSLNTEEYLIFKDKVKQNFSLTELSKYFYDNYNFKDKRKNLLNLSSNNSFENYYRFDTYKKIKSIVENNRVMSIGIDPMIAVMNDLKVIDGYHTVYPLSYKTEFRNIIKAELDINPQLQNYYDNWGNRIYIFFNDQNNILVDFKSAYNLGARFVISTFEINNLYLEFVDCINCYYEKNIYLYKINNIN